jgi:hypothetical protein
MHYFTDTLYIVTNVLLYASLPSFHVHPRPELRLHFPDWFHQHQRLGVCLHNQEVGRPWMEDLGRWARYMYSVYEFGYVYIYIHIIYNM